MRTGALLFAVIFNFGDYVTTRCEVKKSNRLSNPSDPSIKIILLYQKQGEMSRHNLTIFSFYRCFANKSKPNKPENHKKNKDTACSRSLELSSYWLNKVETQETTSVGKLYSIATNKVNAKRKHKPM